MKLSRYFVALCVAAVCALNSRATIDPTLQMQLGNPTGATADPTNQLHYLIQRPQYALDYNNTTQEPNWVAWDLTTADVGGSGRSNAFSPDTGLPAGFYEVTTTDYNGVGSMVPEFNRGHMCPSEDRTDTVADNLQVFLMTNIVPQSADNNQGPWELFEDYCRTQASAGSEVLIISGPSVFNGPYSFVDSSYRLPSGKVAIPSFTWKIAVFVPLGSGTALSRITASTPVIAIKIPNIGGIISDPWQKYVTSVAQLQTDTGFTFFSALDPSVAATFDTEVYGSTTGTPTITAQPAPQTSPVGGSASFAVTATGNATLTYQWSKDGAPLSGATASTLSLVNIQLTDAGNYTVTITNGVGNITSLPAALSISGIAPSISAQPVPRTAPAGSETIFTVTASGSPNLTYQWYLGATPLTDAGTHYGSATSALVITDVQASDAGSYSVVVTNSVNSAVSTSAALSVTPAAPSITTQPAAQSSNVGGSATFTVAAAGTEPLNYQWIFGTTPIPGANLPSLTLTNVQTTNAGNYSVTISNGLGTPVTTTPVALTVNTASTGTLYWDFTVATPVSGLPSDVTGGAITQVNNFGTTTLLTTTSASSGYTGASGTFNAGMAVNKGAFNAATNSYFQFTLTPVAGKELSATSISFGERSTATGSTAYSVFTSVDNYTTAVATGPINNNSTWVLFNPAFTSVTGLSGAPITFRIYLYGYVGTSSPSSGTANCRIDDLKLGVSTIVAPIVPVTPTVSATIPAANSTNISVTTPISITFNEPVTPTGSWVSVSSATLGAIPAVISGGPTTYTVTPVSNLPFSDTITVFVTGAQVFDQATDTLTLASDYSFAFTTASPTPPSFTTEPLPQTVPAGSNVSFTVAATGTAPITFQWRKAGAPISGATGTTYSLTNVQASDAADYDVIATNLLGPTPSTVATLTVTPAAPTIVTPPLGQTVVAGQPVQLSVVASGTTPFSYQWYLGVTPIPAATSATYSIPSVQSTDAGSYTVVVMNGVLPNATSTPVVLTVNPVSSGSILWNFTVDANPASGVPGDLAASAVSQGNNNGTTALVTSVSASSGYTGVSGGNNGGAAARIGALSTASGGSAYFEFTLTPVPGKTVTLAGISFGARSTSTGPQAYTLLSSADGFVTPVVSGTVLANSVWTLYSPTLSPVSSGAGTPITFRIYGSGGGGSPAAGTANWRIDDLRATFYTREFAAVTLGGLTFTYDGTAKPVSATTNPAGLTVTYTFNGSSVVPTHAGTYAVVATVTDPVYAGSATGILVINPIAATVTLASANLAYDGTPKSLSAVTSPAGVALAYTYNGSATAPTIPGTYAVVATSANPDYTGTGSGTLIITPTALLLHAPTVVGGVDGSVELLTGENVTIGGAGYISGDLLVPGTPTVTVSPTAVYAGTLDGTGSASPSTYTVTLSGTAVLRHVVRRTDPIAFPAVSAPPAPAGTRYVTLTAAGQSAGDFTTLRNLTLALNAGSVAVPPGTYGDFVASGTTAFVFGVAGSTTPAVYNLQSLTVNLPSGSAKVLVVGPVILNINSRTVLYCPTGSAANPAWLTIKVAAGGVTASGSITIYGNIVAPAGTVTLSGAATVDGTVAAQYLILNGTSLVTDPGL